MTTNITTAQIEALRTEAAAAGDHLQMLICDMAANGGERDCDALRMAPLRQHHLIPAGEAEAVARCAEAIEAAAAS